MNKTTVPAWYMFTLILSAMLLLAYVVVFGVNISQIGFWSYYVDDQDHIYIGKMMEISIISDSSVRTIESPVSRYYRITVDRDIITVYSSQDQIFKLDMNGNILEVTEDIGGQLFREVDSDNRREYIRGNNTYVLHRVFGFNYIERISGGESIIIYHDSVFLYIASGVASMMLVIFISMTAVFLHRRFAKYPPAK